ncbi:MAG: hypothetical protein FCKEOINB_02216 [Nitrosomonas sp.]|nr:hypothetical protein [Nitrosomonas sp.]
MRRLSAARRRQMALRAQVRLEVIARDGGCVLDDCQGVAGIGACGALPDRWGFEVHELLPRARGGDPLDADNCVALCPAHHDLITESPQLAYELGLTERSCT